MKRSYLKVGDQSSSGGAVTDGIPLMTHDGTNLTYLGAPIDCPICRSTGTIVARGPRWPGNLMGKQAALEGDLCACGCYPFPVMLASQSDMTMSFEARELADMGFGPDGVSLIHPTLSTHWIRFDLGEEANCEGLVCRAHFADGSVEEGTFDSENVVHFERSDSTLCNKVEIAVEYRMPSGSVIDCLLGAMAR
ncbi:PAAR domain-containing protein [Paraburkholderia sp. D15]|uniref:PAAR domain-containing protein n=1 Tax=Paraburkholderia sp. D15 TaxID=2880218 RepID=UPI00247A455C|nr:PAAR domain-containing protein [Paraburkholderia sp. D15]WGS48135.1 PAAR domain-containing protein [Paraburkholderia sp. D15]